MTAIQWNADFPGIYIDGSRDLMNPGKTIGVMEEGAFVSATRRALDKIASKPVGKDLLTLIGKRSKGIGTKLVDGRVTICYGTGTLTEGQVDFGKAVLGSTFAQGVDPVARVRTSQPVMVKTDAGLTPIPGVTRPGAGSSALVSYNPFGDVGGVMAGSKPLKTILGVDTPAFVALAHELVHAFHYMGGDRSPSRMVEEARTVGAGRYANTRISENAVRKEHNVALRKWYCRPGDCDNPH